MLKKLKSAVAIIAVASAALIAGCAGGGGGESALVGDWTLAEISGEEGAGAEEIAMLEQMGMTIELTVHEDGKAELGIADESLEGSWTAKGDTATFTFEGDDAEATVSGENLTLSAEGSSMVFRKGKAQTGDVPEMEGEEEVVIEE